MDPGASRPGFVLWTTTRHRAKAKTDRSASGPFEPINRIESSNRSARIVAIAHSYSSSAITSKTHLFAAMSLPRATLKPTAVIGKP